MSGRSRPGRQWAAVSGKNKEPGWAPRRRLRATYHRTGGVRHLFAAYELGEDKLYGHIKPSQEPCPVPGVLPLPAHPLAAARADRTTTPHHQPGKRGVTGQT